MKSVVMTINKADLNNIDSLSKIIDELGGWPKYTTDIDIWVVDAPPEFLGANFYINERGFMGIYYNQDILDDCYDRPIMMSYQWVTKK